MSVTKLYWTNACIKHYECVKIKFIHSKHMKLSPKIDLWVQKKTSEKLPLKAYLIDYISDDNIRKLDSGKEE